MLQVTLTITIPVWPFLLRFIRSLQLEPSLFILGVTMKCPHAVEIMYTIKERE